ncbi:HupE/UreJ family protein [Akkermansiaceae bacterium]|nr:HupE/UreJ family protein [Akkermansiaceae bacterium]
MKRLLFLVLSLLVCSPLWGHYGNLVRAEMRVTEDSWETTFWIEAWMFYPEDGPLAQGDPTIAGRSGKQWMDSLDDEAWAIMKDAAEADVRDFFEARLGDEELEFVVSFPDLERKNRMFHQNENYNSLLRIRATGELSEDSVGGFLVDWKEPDEADLVLTVRGRNGEKEARTIESRSGPQELVVFSTEANPEVVRASLWDWVKSGFEHILPKGLDHILFILGLFLLVPKMKPLLAQSLAFTVAHSITLALLVLGVITVPGRLVEAAIALSIAYVGLENLWVKELKRRRLVFVFALGLLHGMGFASVMQELDLPSGSLLKPLIGFNIGVELGQITVLLAAFALTFWALERKGFELFRKGASLVIAVIGFYWVVERLS